MWVTELLSQVARPVLRALFSTLLFAVPCWTTAVAQPIPGHPQLTQDDLERAGRHRPVITEADMDRARRANPPPSEPALSRVPAPSTPNIDALPKPPSASASRPVDLEALARGYEHAAVNVFSSSGAPTGPSLLIFISFAMPEPTLSRLVDQAARSKATLVLRGLVNGSLKETVKTVQSLMGGRKVSFQIDPQAFDRFSVAATPTFVLVREGARPSDCAAGTCLPADAFVSVVGDVSVDYALEHFQRAAPTFDREATFFLRRLRG